MRSILLLLLILTLPARALVPFFSNPAYTRDEPTDPPWFVENNGEPSRLYYNGVYQSQETGGDDLNLYSAWAIQPAGAKVGVVDQTAHGDRVAALVGTVSPQSEVFRHELLRWNAPDIAAGIQASVASGCRVVVVTTGFSAWDDGLSNACKTAEQAGVVICYAVPNVDQDLEGLPLDYPYVWSHEMGNIIGATSTDRDGSHYSPSATGTNCIAAPGRNIVAAGTYSSGTSWSAPILAGCVALLVERYPDQPVENYRSVLRATSTPVSHRVDIFAALNAPVPVLAISRTAITVTGLPGWRYTVERSEDLVHWADFRPVTGSSVTPAVPGFFRVRVGGPT